MTTLYAQPYNRDAVDFYFDDADAFVEQSENLKVLLPIARFAFRHQTILPPLHHPPAFLSR